MTGISLETVEKYRDQKEQEDKDRTQINGKN